MRRRWLWATLAVLIVIAACDGIYRVVVSVPYCPVSDSAKAQADSVPLPCLLDSLR